MRSVKQIDKKNWRFRVNFISGDFSCTVEEHRLWGLRNPPHLLFCLKVKVLVVQSCPALWDPKTWSLLGSSVHRILQAKILEWVAIFSSRTCSRPRNRTCISCLLHWEADWILYHEDHQESPSEVNYLITYFVSLLCPTLRLCLQIHIGG